MRKIWIRTGTTFSVLLPKQGIGRVDHSVGITQGWIWPSWINYPAQLLDVGFCWTVEKVYLWLSQRALPRKSDVFFFVTTLWFKFMRVAMKFWLKPLNHPLEPSRSLHHLRNFTTTVAEDLEMDDSSAKIRSVVFSRGRKTAPSWANSDAIWTSRLFLLWSSSFHFFLATFWFDSKIIIALKLRGWCYYLPRVFSTLAAENTETTTVTTEFSCQVPLVGSSTFQTGGGGVGCVAPLKCMLYEWLGSMEHRSKKMVLGQLR